MFRSLVPLPLFASLLVTHALAQPPIVPPVARYVALQVEKEPDYSATDLQQLLSDGAYVGAVSPSVVTTNEIVLRRQANLPVDDLVSIECRLSTAEIISLTFRGENEKVVETGVEKVLAHLAELVPSRRRHVEDAITRARKATDAARQARAAAAAQVTAFIVKHGSNPDQLLDTTRGRIRSFDQDLATLERDLATTTATRDYLREATSLRDAAAAETLLAEIAAARKVLEDQREFVQETHPDFIKAKERLSKLESEATRTSGQARANSRDLLEARLFATEEEVFAMERRRDWLKRQIQDLSAEAKELTSHADEWDRLRGAQNEAQESENVNTAMLRDAEAAVARMPSGPWIRVLAR